MRRHFLMASAGAMALTGSAAWAADLPMSPPPPPVPVFTWTGVDLGFQAGFAWGNGNLNFTDLIRRPAALSIIASSIVITGRLAALISAITTRSTSG